MNKWITKALGSLPERVLKLLQPNSDQQNMHFSREEFDRVMKGFVSGTAEAGTHAHALIRNMFETRVDGRHRHLFWIRLIDGSIITFETLEDGEHPHTIDSEVSTQVKAEGSDHPHVLRITRDITTAEGLMIASGSVFITEPGGAHGHGADMLESTNFDGAHGHTVLFGTMPDGLPVRAQTLDIETFWKIFGPFDLRHVRPIFSASEITRGFGELEPMHLQKENDPKDDLVEMDDTNSLLLAAFGIEAEEVEKAKHKKKKKAPVYKQEEVQELILDKDKFKTSAAAREKAQELKYDVPEKDVQEGPEQFTLTIMPASTFEAGKFRVVEVEPGVKVRLGKPKDVLTNKEYVDILKQGSEIQSLVFPKDKFTEAQARAWLKRNNKKSGKIDVTENSFRFRQQDPEGFSRFRTTTLPESGGVLAVLGIRKSAPVQKDFSYIYEACPDEILIQKLDAEKQLVLGIVLEPDVLDAQKDVMSAEDIEEAAHGFLKEARTIGFRHTKEAGAELVESYIAPVNFKIKGPNGTQKVKKGTWLINVHVTDPKLWAKIKKKEINAFSVGGLGQRAPA